MMQKATRLPMRIIEPHKLVASYAVVLDALPIVAVLSDAQGAVTYLSSGWKRFTGNDASAVLEQGFLSVVHPDDLERVLANWAIARGDGVAYRDEFRLRFGDGAYRYVASLADPLRDEQDAIVGWFGTLTDIHHLRSVEEQLAHALAAAASSALEARRRAEFVERLMDASDDVVIVLDNAGCCLSHSANAARTFGTTTNDSLVGSSWLDLWSGDDETRGRAALVSALDGEHGRFTGGHAASDGTVWWDVTVTPIRGADGSVDHILTVARDVTETLLAHRALAQSEAHARVLRDALPGVTWTATPNGELDFVSGEPLRAGDIEVDRLGSSWLDVVHPDDRERIRALWAHSIATSEPYEALMRVLRAGGQYRWNLVRALPQHDETGLIVRWVGVNVDVDDQHRADESREQFVRLAEASDDLISISDEHGRITYVNEAARRLLNLGSLDDAAQATYAVDFFGPGDHAFFQSQILPTIEREGRWLGEFRLRNFQSGTMIPVWYNAFALVDEGGRTTGMASVSRDLRARLRVEAGLRALADAGAAIYSSLDFAGTVRNIADAVARSFASYCTVDTIDADGRIVTIAAAHSDPALLELVHECAAALNLIPDHPVARAIRHGDVTVMSSLPADWLELTGIRAALGDDTDRLDIRSLISVPIRSVREGQIFGALTCVMDGTDPRNAYTLEDLRFAEEVAVRAGLALDHARAYERERRIAMTLQEASLPGVLPTVDHLALWADYHPGNSEATIGGDWYDAFELDDGRVAITIGDVLGNGLHAAVTMGKVRGAMRAVASIIPDPNAMLDVADRTVRTVSMDTYATAIAGIFDPLAGKFTFASAGHPGPLIRHPTGALEEYRSPGTMLGLRERGVTNVVVVPAMPGATLVFFTDGLVEATRDIDIGNKRLAAALADPSVRYAQNPARALVRHVLNGAEATDDIAVLVAEIRGK